MEADRALREVAVLYGGRSSEREVSLKSGAEVLAGLRTGLPSNAKVRAVEIGVDGRWRLGDHWGDPHHVLGALPAETIYFLALHGGEGENGTTQAFLSSADRRCTGSGVGASALCMDKHTTRLLLAEDGIAVAAGARVLPEDWRAERTAILARLRELSTGPWFVKPSCGGSSVGMHLAIDVAALGAGIDDVHARGEDALIEARVEGIEATCGVLGNRGDELRTLTPVEIRPRRQAFFDYAEKYDETGARELCPPETLTDETCGRLRELAARAHRLARCDGYSRTDFVVPCDARGVQGEPVVLEINTLPGMTARSLLPRAAATDGLAFPDLCVEILRLALAANSEPTP